MEIEDAGKRPVGQVVKTVASHAINIGSNPVRVTSSSKAAYSMFPSKLERASRKIALDKSGKCGIIKEFTGQ